MKLTDEEEFWDLVQEKDEDQETFKKRKEKRFQQAFKLDDVDNRIISLMISYPDLDKTKIAVLCGVSRGTLLNRLKKPALIRAMAELQKSGVELIQDVQGLAMRRIKKLIHSNSEKIALDACKLVLMPMFNQATLQVNTTQEKVFKVQFGDGGSVFLSEDVINNSEKMSPLQIIKHARDKEITLDEALYEAKLD